MYAAQIVDGKCVQVIVGDSQWANQRLGGQWVHSEVLVGVGWLWDGMSFSTPPVPDPTDPEPPFGQ